MRTLLTIAALRIKSFTRNTLLMSVVGTVMFLMLHNAVHAQSSGRYADVNGLRMYYELHGEGSPLLLLHGGGSTIQTTFGRILPFFAGTHLVIAPEQQGHGHTGDIDRPLSFDQMADDTVALLDHLDIQQVDVLGFSNGGNVALALAIRHPERVRKLVAASVFFNKDGLYPPVLESFHTASADNMPTLYREAYREVAPNPQDLPTLVSKLMTNLLQFEGLSPEQLAKIQSPTLLLHGNNDVAPVEHILEFSHLISNSQLAVFPGGHGAYLGEAMAGKQGSKVPELTAILIEEFLEEPTSNE